jgi:hypothetical protein
VSSADDYLEEMPLRPRIDEATAEQLLAGRPSVAGLEPLSMVVRALREVAAKPVSPSAGLAEQMAAGVFTTGPVYRYRPPRPGIVRVLGSVVGAAAVKLGRMSLALKLLLVGVVAGSLSVGTAGLARTLPEPVQDGFERMVESVVPYQFPEKAADREPAGDTGERPADEPADEPANPPDQPAGPGEETSPPAGTEPTPGPGETPEPSPTPDEDAEDEDDEDDSPGNSDRRCERKPEKCEEDG